MLESTFLSVVAFRSISIPRKRLANETLSKRAVHISAYGSLTTLEVSHVEYTSSVLQFNRDIVVVLEAGRPPDARPPSRYA